MFGNFIHVYVFSNVTVLIKRELKFLCPKKITDKRPSLTLRAMHVESLFIQNEPYSCISKNKSPSGAIQFILIY